VVVPCLNEERHLPELLATLRADPGAADARIVIVDGGSSDNSAAIVRDIAVADARVRLLITVHRVHGMNIDCWHGSGYLFLALRSLVPVASFSQCSIRRLPQ
jgi:succinoglycan biosynthesis protein ExoA